MDNSPSTIAPLLLRNLLTSIFVHTEKSLFYLSEKYQILHLLRSFLVSAFLFFLSLLPSFFSSLTPRYSQESHSYPLKSTKNDNFPASIAAAGGGDSGVSRALSQLLLIMNDIPVSSRKYEVVRSLAEKLIDENLLEKNRALRDVNCAVLSAAFARSLSQLEAAMVLPGRRSGGGDVAAGAREGDYYTRSKAISLLEGVKYYVRAAWRYAISSSQIMSRSGSSAEKLAAELLWLAQKMAASGCAEEAVCKWASASTLAWLALSTEPRLQGSLVKVSAFLIKEAKEIGKDSGREVEEEDDVVRSSGLEQQQKIRETKMKMLMSWLPLLCGANNGTDAPILSMAERAELERILEEIIWTLDKEDEQEMVLSLWLHHFTYCPASDWPNLRSCYTQWYAVSRASLVLSAQPSASASASASIACANLQ